MKNTGIIRLRGSPHHQTSGQSKKETTARTDLKMKDVKACCTLVFIYVLTRTRAVQISVEINDLILRYGSETLLKAAMAP